MFNQSASNFPADLDAASLLRLLAILSGADGVGFWTRMGAWASARSRSECRARDEPSPDGHVHNKMTVHEPQSSEVYESNWHRLTGVIARLRRGSAQQLLHDRLRRTFLAERLHCQQQGQDRGGMLSRYLQASDGLVKWDSICAGRLAPDVAPAELRSRREISYLESDSLS